MPDLSYVSPSASWDWTFPAESNGAVVLSPPQVGVLGLRLINYGIPTVLSPASPSVASNFQINFGIPTVLPSPSLSDPTNYVNRPFYYGNVFTTVVPDTSGIDFSAVCPANGYFRLPPEFPNPYMNFQP